MRPSEFPTLPLKRLMRPTSTGAVSIKGHLDDLADDEGFPAYSASGQDVRLLAPQFDGEGLVLSAVGAQCGKCFYASGQWGVVANTQVFLPTERGDARYLFYLVNQRDFWDVGGTAQPYVQVPRSMSQPVPAPPLETQRRIAQFLDEKTVRIDTLIEKKRELIDRLTEKRQALIAHAVTNGLNPDASMKPSGIDWLAEIPLHWEVTPVKRIAVLESGHTPDRKIEVFWEDCDIPWVSLNDTELLRAADYISDTTVKINVLGLTNSSARMLPERAVVFTRDATIGESAITTRPMAVSQHIIAWLCVRERVVEEFLLLAIYGMKGELLRLTNGSTIGTIGLSDVKAIRIALPPLGEQKEIVSGAFQRKSELEEISGEIERSIDQLSEYRSALITAAVTGQISELK